MACEMEEHVRIIMSAGLQTHFPRSIFVNMGSKSGSFLANPFEEIGDFRPFQQEDAQAFAVLSVCESLNLF